MNLLLIQRWLVALSIVLSMGRLLVVAADGSATLSSSAAASSNSLLENDNADDLEVQVLKETIAAGRGHRDEPGIRDQWDSTEHLRQKIDTRKPVTPKVKALLKRYGLDCESCDEKEAVAKINDFVKETKRQAEEEAKRQTWLERAAAVVTIIVLGGVAYLHSQGAFAPGGGIINGYVIGGASNNGMSQGRRLEIEEQRRRAAKKEEEEAKLLAAQAKEAPSWRENEEKEIWTPKQEKQFAQALVSFGGVPPKARYTLIADKVDDKNRQECLMHHKLLQLIAKEQ